MTTINYLTDTDEEIEVEVGLSKHGTLHRKADFDSAKHFRAYDQIDACDLAQVLLNGRHYFLAHCGQNFLDEARHGVELVRYCGTCFPGWQELYEQELAEAE